MKMLLCRFDLQPERTLGDLYLDGQRFCNTLEDTVRDPGVKVPGKTAIPSGNYEVQVTWSPRFQMMMPLVMNVPMFEGIRIHPGNTERHTEGCILVGMSIVDNARLVDSKLAYEALMSKLIKGTIYRLEVANVPF